MAPHFTPANAMPRCLFVVFMSLVLSAYAIDRLPIEDFSKEPSMSRARLSPDGKRVAFLRQFGTKATLHIAGIDDKTLTRLDLGEAGLLNGATKDVDEFTWIGDDRLMVNTAVWDMFYGSLATNWDGGHSVPISGYEDEKVSLSGTKIFAREILHCFFDKDSNVLMLDRQVNGPGSSSHPDILKVDSDLGLL
jgi:hypothetical protein